MNGKANISRLYSAWRCTKDDAQTTEKETVQTEEESDLPF